MGRAGSVMASGPGCDWGRCGGGVRAGLFLPDELCFHDLLADLAGGIQFVDDDLHGIGVDADVFDGGAAFFAFGIAHGGLEGGVAVVFGPFAGGDAAFAVDGHVIGFLRAGFEGDHAFRLAFACGEGDADGVFADAPVVAEGGFAAGGFPFTDHPAEVVLFDEVGEGGRLERGAQSEGGEEREEDGFHGMGVRVVR